VTVPRGKDAHAISGFNFRMNEIQGAIGLVQLHRLDHVLERQCNNKFLIKKELVKVDGLRFRDLTFPDGDGGDTLVFFVPTSKQAQEVSLYLESKGIGTKILPEAMNWHFSGNWSHMLGRFSQFRVDRLASLWPRSDEILGRAIAIPISVRMTEELIYSIIQSVKEAAERHLYA